MSDKPIPETDEEANRILNDLSRMRIDGWSDAYLDMRLHAEKLERERDDAITAIKALLKDHNQFSTDRYETEGVDPYGNDSEAFDLANKIINK